MVVVEGVPLTTCPRLVLEHPSVSELREEMVGALQIAIVCIDIVVI